MLNQSDVARYLLRKELITTESLVDGDVQVVSESRRNQNWKVINDSGPSYFLKQGIGPNKTESVAHEAAVYELLTADPKDPHVRAHLPHVFGFDREHNLMTLELLGAAQDFREYHTRGRFSKVCGESLGRVLSELHRAFGPEVAASFPTDARAHAPWALSLHRPSLAIFHDASNANLQLIRILQNTQGFGQLLDRLRQQWRVDGFIHNDIKWDNCLVLGGENPKRKPKIRIVDWEFAGLGDRCWDVGAIFSNYLSCWLASVPITGEEPPDHFLDLAKYPLEQMQPALRAYWQAYSSGMQLDESKADEWLLRSVTYAGARLLQTGFEQMQYSSRLTGNLVCMLQLSLNIMQQPREAAAQLLGISRAAGQAGI